MSVSESSESSSTLTTRQLQKTLEVLKGKTAALEQDLEQETVNTSPEIFNTNDPTLNRHAVSLVARMYVTQLIGLQYVLRAVLMHDGALVAGSHLYVYIRQADGKWWRVQDHEVKPVCREWRNDFIIAE